MPEYCKIDKTDHIMTVTLDRPERLNALHPPANVELGEVFDDFAVDEVELVNQVLEGLSEYAIGEWEDMPFQHLIDELDFINRATSDHSFAPPGGESLRGVARRIVTVTGAFSRPWAARSPFR